MQHGMGISNMIDEAVVLACEILRMDASVDRTSKAKP